MNYCAECSRLRDTKGLGRCGFCGLVVVAESITPQYAGRKRRKWDVFMAREPMKDEEMERWMEVLYPGSRA